MINNLLLLTTKKAEKNLWEYVFQKMPTEDTMNKSMIYALVLVVGLKKRGEEKEKQREANPKLCNFKLQALHMKCLSLWNYRKKSICIFHLVLCTWPV